MTPRLQLGFGFCFWFFLPLTLAAQPTISDLSIRGIQIGATTQIVVKGKALSKGTKIHLPFDFQQKSLAEEGDKSITYDLQLLENIRPGLYPLRVYNGNGVSGSMMVGVDRLPQSPFQEKISIAGAATGSVVGAQIAKTTFVGKKGQIVVAEVEANRLGSKLRPVIHIYDSRGKQVTFGPSARSLSGDSRCLLKIPEDGEYTIEIHDVLFRGASPGFFRLKVGDFDFADVSLPVGIQAGKKSVLRLIKSGMSSELLIESPPTAAGWVYPSLETTPNFSGWVPEVLSRTGVEFVETQQSDKPVNVGPSPLGINGRLEKNRETDQYMVEVIPKSKIRFELFGRRIGSTIDGKITLKTEQGQVLKTNDDRPGQQDALIDFDVPDKMQRMIVEISDVTATGSNSHIYRLVVNDPTARSITASVSQTTFNLPKNGRALIPVTLQRNHYTGPVNLVVKGLPVTYHAAPATVAAGSDVGLLTITTTDGGPADFSVLAEIADGLPGEPSQRVDVLPPENSINKNLRVNRKYLTAGTVSSKELAMVWSTEPDDQPLYLGGQMRSAISLKRSDDLKGIVRIRLVTNQKPPKKRIKKNNKDTIVDDVERTLRSTIVELQEGQTNSLIQVDVPNDLAEKSWDLAVVAELLSADKKKVLLASSSMVKTLNASRGAEVNLTSPASLAIPQTGSATLELAGNIVRKSASGPLRISLTNLPQGISIPPVVIQDENAEFSAKFKLEVNPELLKLKKLDLDFSILDKKDLAWVVAKAKPISIKLMVAPKTVDPKTVDPKKNPDKKSAEESAPQE